MAGPAPEVDTASRIRPEAWERLAADFSATPPQFIVDTEVGHGAQFPLRRFGYLAGLVASDYRVAARFTDAVIYQRCTSAARLSVSLEKCP